MPLDLQAKYRQMQQDGEELAEFGKGFLVRAVANHCSITAAPRTALTNIGMLKHDSATIIELHILTGTGIGEGSKGELVSAVNDGRITTENPETLLAAIDAGRVLYLRQVQGVLLLVKKEGQAEQRLDGHRFFTSTQREEAITEIAQWVERCTHRRFSLHNLQPRDVLAVAAFVALQLP